MAGGEVLMRHGIDNQKVIIVTTSWDDGHPLDVRLAELLRSYGVLGTFYVPLTYGQFPVMDRKQMLDLKGMGMEIGSHTLTHAILTEMNTSEAFREIYESKAMLEDMLGETVSAFCYPKGRFNRSIRSLVMRAGYRLARTLLSFRTELRFDPFRMPVSFQVFPHSRIVHLRRALRKGNVKGILNWCGLWKAESDLLRLARLMFDHVLEHGGIFHVWGHSWEIEQTNLWPVLEAMLQYVGNRQEVLYLTNSQVLNHIGAGAESEP
jgi:peptidoglycan/xylan/chitin deacetylase (PgdA/CDA1 family)